MTMLTRMNILKALRVDVAMVTIEDKNVAAPGLLIRMEKYTWIINKVIKGLSVECRNDYKLVY